MVSRNRVGGSHSQSCFHASEHVKVRSCTRQHQDPKMMYGETFITMEDLAIPNQTIHLFYVTVNTDQSASKTLMSSDLELEVSRIA
jgi:hypothetical protein